MNDNELKKTFAKNLNEVMRERGKIQMDLMKDLNLSSSTVSSWCTGLKMPRMGKVQMLADYLCVPKSRLIEDQSHTLPAGAFEYNPTHRIPILGRISAGMPLYAEENIEGYMYTELNHGGEYFGLRVVGDSMTAERINDGDLLIIRRQDIVENGEIAVVIVGDDEATVKCFYRNDNIVTLMPRSYNPVHKPQIYDLQYTSIRILGKLVQSVINH